MAEKTKSTWLLVIGSFVGIAFIVFVAYRQQRAAELYRLQRGEYCSSLLASSEQKKACKEEHTSAADYLPWGYKLVAWPDGITAWAIIFTGFFIAWQAYESRRAAVSSANAAHAALLNAKALINAERPWLLVSADYKVEANNYEIVVTNMGRTPAELISVSWNRVFKETKGGLPQPVIHKGPWVYKTPPILVSGDSDSAQNISWGQVEQECPDVGRLNGRQIAAFYYGIVCYRDLLGPPQDREHETRFCFWYAPALANAAPKMIRAEGGEGYTGHT